MDWNAAYVFIHTDTEFIVLQQGGVWKLPGGHRKEEDNNPEECAKRELFEEIGLEPDLEDLDPVAFGDRRGSEIVLFQWHVSRIPKESLKAVGDEGEHVFVLPLSKLSVIKNIIITSHRPALAS